MATVPLKAAAKSLSVVVGATLKDPFISVCLGPYLECGYCDVVINKLGIVIESDRFQHIKRGSMLLDCIDCPIKEENGDTAMHGFLLPHQRMPNSFMYLLICSVFVLNYIQSLYR